MVTCSFIALTTRLYRHYDRKTFIKLATLWHKHYADFPSIFFNLAEKYVESSTKEKRQKRKKQRRVVISDDESSDDDGDEVADGDESDDDGSQREVLYDSEENEIDAEAEPEEKKFAGFGKRGRYEITYRNAQGAMPLHQHDISSTVQGSFFNPLIDVPS
jgi:hypothetical protein